MTTMPTTTIEVANSACVAVAAVAGYDAPLEHHSLWMYLMLCVCALCRCVCCLQAQLFPSDGQMRIRMACSMYVASVNHNTEVCPVESAPAVASAECLCTRSSLCENCFTV